LGRFEFALDFTLHRKNFKMTASIPWVSELIPCYSLPADMQSVSENSLLNGSQPRQVHGYVQW